MSQQKSCQFVFRCSAEFYFTQKIKCQSLPDSGIDTTVYVQYQYSCTALDTWDPARSILLLWPVLSHRRCVYFLAKEGSKVRLVLGFLHTQYRPGWRAGDDLLLPTVNQFPLVWPVITATSSLSLAILSPASSARRGDTIPRFQTRNKIGIGGPGLLKTSNFIGKKYIITTFFY